MAPYQHFSLPGFLARVEGKMVVLEKDGARLIEVAVGDVDKLALILKAAARSAKTDAAKVKTLGKPRETTAKK
jgi:Iap family predicted aminopeptidase